MRPRICPKRRCVKWHLPAGRVRAGADFARYGLAYERRLLVLDNGGSLTGSVGLTYVNLNVTVNGDGEDFYGQELPVPILGARLDYRWTARLGTSATRGAPGTIARWIGFTPGISPASAWMASSACSSGSECVCIRANG